jgi:hypothetical protein
LINRLEESTLSFIFLICFWPWRWASIICWELTSIPHTSHVKISCLRFSDFGVCI